MPKPPAPNNYKTLLKNVNQELTNLETILKNRSVEAARNIGRHIHVYLLEGQDRAKYGANVLSKLAKDVKRDVSVLHRALKFYRAYPIVAAPPQLTLEHFRSLITIEDDKERKKAEQKAIQQGVARLNRLMLRR